MINPNIILDEYKDEQIKDDILQDEKEQHSEVDGVVQAIGEILMKEEEKSIEEVKLYNLACEEAISFLGQIVKNWAKRYERTEQIQMRKPEKQALVTLSHITTKGIYYQKEQHTIFEQQQFLFKDQFEIAGR
ncbi:MAG: hypothetical protein EZS28_018562 [Streblomastix strix]|uniref:Uncharacterized protein n=1 Tax=Streblomastix strix TaxID=222440 RepID=A0A5J4VTF0_9EUKA|nr:MAG: hypothetical protein EZS28_018562 [Streblomastix strix]